MVDETVTVNRHLYQQKPDDNRSAMQVLHEILPHMELDGFLRGRTTIFESGSVEPGSSEVDTDTVIYHDGPMAKIEYGVSNTARFAIKKKTWFRRNKNPATIELKLELHPLANKANTIEIISKLRELTA